MIGALIPASRGSDAVSRARTISMLARSSVQVTQKGPDIRGQGLGLLHRRKMAA